MWRHIKTHLYSIFVIFELSANNWYILTLRISRHQAFLQICKVFFVCLCVNYQLYIVVVVYQARLKLKLHVFCWIVTFNTRQLNSTTGDCFQIWVQSEQKYSLIVENMNYSWIFFVDKQKKYNAKSKKRPTLQMCSEYGHHCLIVSPIHTSNTQSG